MKQLGVIPIVVLPPNIIFTGTHLYTWVERVTVGVMGGEGGEGGGVCLAQVHNTMSPARTQTQPGVKCNNHGAVATPQ